MKHQAKQKISKAERMEILNEMQGRSMVHPSFLDTPAFKLIEKEYGEEIRKGPNYICNICWKTEYRTSVIELDPSKHDEKLFDQCHTNNYSHDQKIYIGKDCDRAMKKKKLPMQVQFNGLELCPKFDELKNLCPLEITPISQIMPFMHVCAKIKGAEHGLKGQVVLTFHDLCKVQRVLPRCCDVKYLIPCALKCRLSDESTFNKQYI